MAQFGYNLYITGDCSSSNSGIINITLSGGVEPYIVDFFNPNLGTGSTKGGLSAGVYQIRVNDSLGDVNNEFFISAIVSSGGCINATSVSATTCGLANGSVTLTGSSTAFPVLYKILSGTTVIQSASTIINSIEFDNLASGIYEAYFQDSGGCSGYSESFIILPSSQLDYGFYVVDDTNCLGDVGKLIITGLTGTPPFTYLWSNGSTGTTITGLTADTYSVTVSDASGCEITKSAIVNDAPPLTIVSLETTSPTCFSGNGTCRVVISGGTGPFYYSGSNGTSLISYATDVTFTGFSAGNVVINVTDATLCKTTASTYLQAASGFSVIGLNVQNSVCEISGGTITVNLQGDPPFIFSLVKPDSSVEQSIQLSNNYTFSNLDSGTYTVIISNNSNCEYEQEVNVFTSDKFQISVSTTGTTCGFDNGVCYVSVGSGYTGVLDYFITQNGFSVYEFIDVVQTGITFNGLTSGNYTLQVRDQENCTVTTNFSITTSETLDFGLSATNCGSSDNEGTITTTIFSGVPPFTYNWLENVTTPNQPNLVGLSGGTYTLTVTDSSGCTLTRSVVVPCTPNVSGYQVIPIFSETMTTTYNNQRDMLSMLNEGFYDLTSGNTNCVLVEAIFTATIEISGNTYTEAFYTGTTLNDIPSESIWVDTIESILSGITGVGSYTVNPNTNRIEIKSDCDGTTDELGDSEFISGLIINYDINCQT